MINVVRKSSNAVVTVVNMITGTQGYAGEALGTGVIADQQGHIFTNNHVITGSSPGGLSVIFSTGQKNPLVNTLMNFKPGDTVTLTVIRNGQQLSTKVTLGTRPADLGNGGNPGAPTVP